MNIKPFLISPPFGTWINTSYATSVRGTFTWERRMGLLYHALKTIRPIKGGWVNRIGLRKGSIRTVTFKENDRTVTSLAGLNNDDWENILDFCPGFITPELNLSCPNVSGHSISPITLLEYCFKFSTVIAKLPPTDQVDDLAAMCVEAGVQYLHLCNTIPTERGGESGDRLFRLNLPIVERLAAKYKEKISIIAGGGIYGPEQAMQYKKAGARHLSLATIYFTPWKVRSICEHS